MTQKKEKEKDSWISTAVFLGLLIVALAVIFAYTTIQDREEYQFIEGLDTPAQLKYIDHMMELQEMSQQEMHNIGKFFWDLLNIPIPLVLVILLLIALAPTSTNKWKKEK